MADLAQIARDVARAPAVAVRAAAAAVAVTGDRAGGRMRWHGRDVALTVDVRIRDTPSGSAATIAGTPAGAWAIKSNGRRGGYRAHADPGSALSLTAVVPGLFVSSVSIRRGTTGDRRWDRLAGTAADELAAATSAAVHRAVT
jgi:hypothetical protein